MNFLEEINKLSLKDLITLIFSGTIALFAFLQWKIRKQDFVMQELKTACKNFFTICLNVWIKNLDEIIINGSAQEFRFDEDKKEFYFFQVKNLDYPPEFEKYTPWRLKKECNYLWRNVKECKSSLIDAGKNICDLANKCFSQMENDLSILTIAKLNNVEVRYTIDFIINAIVDNYETAHKKLIAGRIEKGYVEFFLSPVVKEFIERIKKENIHIIELNDAFYQKAMGLVNLLVERRQKLSIEYHIPLQDVGIKYD